VLLHDPRGRPSRQACQTTPGERVAFTESQRLRDQQGESDLRAPVRIGAWSTAAAIAERVVRSARS
jgi:hypothetical protein